MPPDSTSGIGTLQRRRAPDQLHRLVEEQDHAEGRQHLVEMVAVVEMPEDQHFQQQPERQRRRQRQQQRREQKLPVSAGEGRRQIGAQHVLHAVGEVDEVHHAEHQRQAGRDQEQQDAELQAVQRLDQEQSAWSWTVSASLAAPSRDPVAASASSGTRRPRRRRSSSKHLVARSRSGTCRRRAWRPSPARSPAPGSG